MRAGARLFTPRSWALPSQSTNQHPKKVDPLPQVLVTLKHNFLLKVLAPLLKETGGISVIDCSLQLAVSME